jgi:hypothetical protein
MDILYKFYVFPEKYPRPTALTAQIDDHHRNWHERLKKLNFQSLKLMVKHDKLLHYLILFLLMEYVKGVCLASITKLFLKQ